VGSTVYTIAGGLLMNGVLQAVVYPLLNRQMGSEPLGALLFIMGVLGILSPSVGQALNTSRLVVRRTSDVTNGDYNTLLLVFGVIGGVITLIICRTSFGNAGAAAATFVLLMLMIFRYYGDVEYRLSLHYEKYFIYYAVLTAGYLVGFALYYVTKIWFFIFIVGEGAALVYLTITGSVFKNFLVRSRYFRTAAERGTFLMFSYVITNLTLNIDRLALKFLIDDLAVTKYYVASLLGKTLILLVTPVNTIIISFLTKRKKELDKREYLMFVGAGAGVAAAFFAAIQIAAPIFLKIFY
jgi:O-antigen/teichoic acid export membrane protein